MAQFPKPLAYFDLDHPIHANHPDAYANLADGGIPIAEYTQASPSACSAKANVTVLDSQTRRHAAQLPLRLTNDALTEPKARQGAGKGLMQKDFHP